MFHFQLNGDFYQLVIRKSTHNVNQIDTKKERVSKSKHYMIKKEKKLILVFVFFDTIFKRPDHQIRRNR